MEPRNQKNMVDYTAVQKIRLKKKEKRSPKVFPNGKTFGDFNDHKKAPATKATKNEETARTINIVKASKISYDRISKCTGRPRVKVR